MTAYDGCLYHRAEGKSLGKMSARDLRKFGHLKQHRRQHKETNGVMGKPFSELPSTPRVPPANHACQRMLRKSQDAQ